MVRYKRYDYGRPARFQQQILQGTFESTLKKLIDEHINCPCPMASDRVCVALS